MERKNGGKMHTKQKLSIDPLHLCVKCTKIFILFILCFKERKTNVEIMLRMSIGNNTSAFEGRMKETKK